MSNHVYAIRIFLFWNHAGKALKQPQLKKGKFKNTQLYAVKYAGILYIYLFVLVHSLLI